MVSPANCKERMHGPTEATHMPFVTSQESLHAWLKLHMYNSWLAGGGLALTSHGEGERERGQTGMLVPSVAYALMT